MPRQITTNRAQRQARAGQSITAMLVVLVIVAIGIMTVVLVSRQRGTRSGSGASSASAGSVAPASSDTAPGARRGAGTGMAPAATLPVIAHKQPPTSPGFEGCPAEGDHGDPALNRLKNRVDSAAWIPVAFDAVLDLPWPPGVERRDRATWSRGASREVSRWEGLPITIEGFLAGAKQETPESPNCHGADARFRDWHLWLSAQPGKDRRRSIVVETTPIVRARRPGWSLARLRRLARDSTAVRVSGWLMLDPEHPDQVGRTRGTIWEIHPIMRIEARVGGRWVPMEDLPRGGR